MGRTARRWGAITFGMALLLAAVTGCGTIREDAASTRSAPAATPDSPVAPGAVWPSRDQSTLLALQDLSDRGRRPDLLDPVDVARQYAAAAMPGAAALAAAPSTPMAGAFTATGPTTGEVPVAGSGLSPSTVYLRRLERHPGKAPTGPPPSIWYVQGVGSALLAVLDVDYDGQRLVASFVPGGDGTLTVRVTGLGESLLTEQVTSARTEHLITIDAHIPGQPALVISASLALADGSVAPREFRIGAPPPAN